jgi:hypothetical protein
MPDLVIPARNSRTDDDFSPARESARSLAAMGGSMPDLVVADAPIDSDDFGGMKVVEDPTPYGKPRKAP